MTNPPRRIATMAELRVCCLYGVHAKLPHMVRVRGVELAETAAWINGTLPAGEIAYLSGRPLWEGNTIIGRDSVEAFFATKDRAREFAGIFGGVFVPRPYDREEIPLS